MSGEEDIDYEDEIEQRKNDVIVPDTIGDTGPVGPVPDPRNYGY